MVRRFLTIVVLVALTCALTQVAQTAEPGSKESAPAGGGAQHLVVLPNSIDWRDGPPSLPPGAKFAVLEGDPAKPGIFTMRAKLPDGFRIPPHWHPGVERVTILSGTFHLGHGERFDKAAAPAMPAGSYSAMQPGMRHFGWAEGETVVQLTTEGPWGITYVNPNDDPRAKH
jgi:hypothetical protein